MCELCSVESVPLLSYSEVIGVTDFVDKIIAPGGAVSYADSKLPIMSEPVLLCYPHYVQQVKRELQSNNLQNRKEVNDEKIRDRSSRQESVRSEHRRLNAPVLGGSTAESALSEAGRKGAGRVHEKGRLRNTFAKKEI